MKCLYINIGKNTPNIECKNRFYHNTFFVLLWNQQKLNFILRHIKSKTYDTFSEMIIDFIFDSLCGNLNFKFREKAMIIFAIIDKALPMHFINYCSKRTDLYIFSINYSVFYCFCLTFWQTIVILQKKIYLLHCIFVVYQSSTNKNFCLFI